jgi:hypothetical protein
MNLHRQVQHLIRQGVYDPEDLFKIVYQRNRVHYSKVREAVHQVKVK